MKTLRQWMMAAVFCVVGFTQGSAFAETIGGGSIRVTAAEPGAQIKIRYVTEQGTVEKTIDGTEVLHLSTFKVKDQGNQFPLLEPTFNQFNLYKSETTDFIITGGSDDLVRLSFEQGKIQDELKLDFQWVPKLQILTSPADKVEVLDDSDQILHAVGEDALFLNSDNGMAIRFVVQEPVDNGGTDSGNEGETGSDKETTPQGQASGGCSMAAKPSGIFGSAWYLLLPAAFAMVRRIRCNS